MQTLIFNIAAQEAGERLDKVLTDRLNADPNLDSSADSAIHTGSPTALSRVRVQQLIKEGFVTVNNKLGKASYRVDGTESVTVGLSPEIVAPPDANANVVPEALPLTILYDDPHMAGIDKPAGMVVHPAVGHTHGTLVNAILSRWPQVALVGGEGRAGIVHRLDMETSGVILIAKTEAARLSLMNQFAERTIQKRYIALVEGVPNTQTGEINAPIGRDLDKRKQMAVILTTRGGREAISHFRILERFDGCTLVEVLPKTGRTHQIRVHMAFIGHPIVGDRIYGPRKQRIKLNRHFLHAQSITLTAPATGQPLTVSAPLPPELEALLARLRAKQDAE